MNLNERLNKEQAKIDQHKENQGPDYEEEIKKKEQLINNLKKDKKQEKRGGRTLKKNRKTKKGTRKDQPTSYKYF